MTDMQNDLIREFEKIGVRITPFDVPTILQIGADNYLKKISCETCEETMTGIYIILNEMRSGTNMQSGV